MRFPPSCFSAVGLLPGDLEHLVQDGRSSELKTRAAAEEVAKELPWLRFSSSRRLTFHVLLTDLDKVADAHSILGTTSSMILCSCVKFLKTALWHVWQSARKVSNSRHLSTRAFTELRRIHLPGTPFVVPC